MKRAHRLRYAITFLASVALTFHFLQSRSLQESPHQGKRESRTFRLSNALLHALPKVHKAAFKAGFQVLQGNITVHVGEDKNGELPEVILNPTDLCSNLEESRLKLLIFIASTADNFVKRQAIRDTWGLRSLQLALNFRLVFVLGHSLDDIEAATKESVRYGDILKINSEETFRNLGLKSASGLSWSKSYCSNADFIMKTDDDILVHVPNLINALQSAKNPESLLLCHENRMRKILRKELLTKVPKHYDKYEVLAYELPGVFYPPYCSGLAYAFSRTVRDRLLWASSVTPVFFIEDVYLTGFCRHKAGVLITPAEGITLRPQVTPAQAACAFMEGRITSHEVGVSEMRELWAEINTQGFFCPEVVGYARGIAAYSNISTSEG